MHFDQPDISPDDPTVLITRALARVIIKMKGHQEK